jgi:hypothetical protein
MRRKVVAGGVPLGHTIRHVYRRHAADLCFTNLQIYFSELQQVYRRHAADLCFTNLQTYASQICKPLFHKYADLCFMFT